MPGRKLPEETRREDILRAAYDVAARRGLEALTLRAVAGRAAVSHGTVQFHFRRRDALVAALLDRVLYATAVLRVPDAVEHLTRPVDRLRALLRSEMERLSEDARHFRLFLEYWALGVRKAAIRHKMNIALTAYRGGFRSLAAAVVDAAGESPSASATARAGRHAVTPDGLAAVSVSLIHGCALQALIDARAFNVQQHIDAAVRLLEKFAGGRQATG